MSLVSIIENLTPQQIRVARKFVTAFQPRITGQSNKALVVFDAIRLKKSSYARTREKVGSTTDKRSFDRLVIRLKERVIESLMLDMNVTKKGAFSNRGQHWIDIRKRYIIAQILWGKGLMHEAYEQMHKVIKAGMKYELFEVVEEVLTELYFDGGFRIGQHRNYNVAEQLEFVRKCRAHGVQARTFYHRYFNENVTFSGIKKESLDFLVEAITSIDQHYRETQTDTVGFYLFTLRMEYYLTLNEFLMAAAEGERLVNLVRNSSALFSKRKLAAATGDLADAYLQGGQFTIAAKTATDALELYSPIDTNYPVELQTLVIAQIHSGNLTDVKQSCAELAAFRGFKEAPFKGAIRQAIQANVLFLHGKYNESLKVLNNCFGYEKDLEGWNLGIRTLGIMLAVELKKFDLAEAWINKLRVYVQNASKQVELRKRDTLILTLLRHLANKGFQFRNCAKNDQKLLEDLAKPVQGYAWEIKTPEIIIFHEWFKAKVNNQPYNHAKALANVQKTQKATKKKKAKLTFDL